MGNDTLIKRTLILLVVLVLFTIVMLVMVGPNSIINQEKEEYEQTHMEDKDEKKGTGNVVVIEDK